MTRTTTRRFTLRTLSPLALALAAGAAHAQVTNWTALGTADALDPANWDNGVPTILDDAFINNGGTAQVSPDNAGNLNAGTLFLGVNGGDGTLVFPAPVSERIVVGDSLLIGATLSGSATSIGRLTMIDSSVTAVDGPGTGVFRAGYTQASGDAHAMLDLPESALGISTFSPEFALAQLGVTDAGGDATVDALLDDFSSIKGLATNLDIGVSNGAGTATATIENVASFLGDGSGPGDLNIGVANDAGDAVANVLGSPFIFGTQACRNWSVVNVGISNGTGTANALLEVPNGIRADTLNVGRSLGGGSADATLKMDHGLTDVNTLHLGDGATMISIVTGPVRGVTFALESYAAVDADTAILDGDLVADFYYVPQAMQRFECVVSGSPTGITGDFDSVTLLNLPQGFGFTSGVVLDKGVEKYVIDLTGAPAQPVWLNPATGMAAGGWFDDAQWASPLAPTGGDEALINNGGEARADAGTAPGPMRPLSLFVGQDGGSGTLTSDGVDLGVRRSLAIGYVSPDNAAPGAATGSATFSGATVEVLDLDRPFNVGILGSINIGFAQGDGDADGSLVMHGGSIRPLEDIHVGVAEPVIAGVSSDVTGSFVLNGAGIGVSELSAVVGTNTIDVGHALDIRADAPVGVLTADGTLTVTDATIRDMDVWLAEANCNEPGSTATATGVATLTNVEVIDGAADVTDVRAGDSGAVADASGTLNLTDVDFNDLSLDGFPATFDWCDVGAFNPGANASGVAHVNALRVNIHQPGGDIELADTSVNGGTPENPNSASNTATVLYDTGTIVLEDLEVALADVSDAGTATVDADVTFQSVTLDAETIEFGFVGANGQGAVDLDSVMDFIDAAITLSESAVVGRVVGNSTAAGSTVNATLALAGSTMTTPLLEIGATNEPGVSMDAIVSLNPSLLSADQLDLGPDGTLVFGIRGLDRVTAGTVGTPSYAAADTDESQLDGTIVADFDGFAPPAGQHTFDLLVGSSFIAGAPTLSVQNLPAGFDVEFFGVTKSMAGDQLRLVIGTCPGDLTTTGGGAPGEPDGVTDLADLLFFVNAWDADLGSPSPNPGSLADVTTTGTNTGDPGFGVPDGNVDLADLLFYVNLWNQGIVQCP